MGHDSDLFRFDLQYIYYTVKTKIANDLKEVVHFKMMT